MPEPRQEPISAFTVTVIVTACLLIPLLLMGFFFQ